MLYAFFVVLLMVFGVGIDYAYQTSTVDNITATVKNKDRECFGSGKTYDCQYMIFTDNEVLKDTDSMWFWKWNSSDFYNNIEIGKTYKFTVNGWRMPFWSTYRNVIDYHSVEKEASLVPNN